MATLTVYGGTNEIGGNQIFLEWSRRRVLLDFGLSFSRFGRYFEEFLRPRSAALGMRDYLRMGLLPPIEGLYREDLTSHDPNLWRPYRSHPLHRRLKRVDAVLLTHAHLDHIGHLGFLRPEVPIQTTLTTALLGKAIQDQKSLSVDGEFCYFALREPDGRGCLRAVRGRARQQRSFHITDADVAALSRCQDWWREVPQPKVDLDSVQLTSSATGRGGLQVRCWPVDHSIPGACAFGVQTDSGWVIYTGDLRMHGRRSDNTRRFVEQAAQLDRGGVVLISEGTRVDETGPRVTEEEVQANILDLMRGEARGRPVIADFGPRNIERLQAFHSAAIESGRRLVITMADAYILTALRLVDKSSPDPDDESICILREPKVVVPHWERAVEARYESRCVSAAEIRREPAAYIVCLSFWDISNFIDLEPERGIYIYSSAEAFNEEMSLDHQRLENWIRHFRLEPVGGLPGQVADAQRRGYHASGHISGAELDEVISAIDPRLIVPVHTEHVDWFRTRWPAKVVDVEYGRPIDLD